MIIRHDIDPALYLADSAAFSAIVPIASHPEEIPIPYDKIDEILKPNLLCAIKSEPDTLLACDGMGSLIRPTWILSVAYVAAGLSSQNTVTFAGVTYPIQQVILHPHCHHDEQAATQIKNDIALIQLTCPVKGIAPLPLFKGTDERSQIATLVGQGDYGTGLIGPDVVDGKMRIATNQIEKVNHQWLLFKFDAPPAATDLEGIAGPGDSGGPALLKTEKGWAIAGIRSGQDSQNLGEGYYGVWEYYTRVSQYIDWIESIVDV